jgi:maleylpyruvate isomerase
VRNYLTNTLKCTKEESNDWYNHWLIIGLTGLEKQITSSKYYTGKFCYKNEFTIADICLVPQLFNLRRFMSELGMAEELIESEIKTKYPTLAIIDANCKKLDAVQLAWPKE